VSRWSHEKLFNLYVQLSISDCFSRLDFNKFIVIIHERVKRKEICLCSDINLIFFLSRSVRYLRDLQAQLVVWLPSENDGFEYAKVQYRSVSDTLWG
jgi:hypothetical protein